MCGICGFVTTNNERFDEERSRSIVSAMSDAIAHRGPDDNGSYVNVIDGVALGHRRLSIIDLDSGQQPMRFGDYKAWIVFNGEIYNYKKIRQELIEDGFVFKTESDTEVLLASYVKWGEECVKKFIGMFAFAIWDETLGRLFCARDRLGIKPLLYFWDGLHFIFASEIKSILEHPIVQRKIDPESVINYLRFNYIPAPKTIFKGIFKLSAAHTLNVDQSGLSLKKYWDPLAVSNSNEGDFSSASEEVRALLEDSIRLRLESDVPVGALLSGGVDSSSVVALMSKMQSQTDTLCVGFDERNFDERSYAQYVAQLFNTNHGERVVSADYLAELKKIIWHLDEPFADASAIPMFHLSRFARERVKVCLSGDGGDEVFAGYNWHSELLWLQKFSYIPMGPLKWMYERLMSRGLNYTLRGSTLLFNVGHSAAEQHYNLISNYSDSHIKQLLNSEFVKNVEWPSNPLLTLYENSNNRRMSIEQALYVDLQTYLAEDVLAKVDRMSMAHSLEVRVPILDHRLVETAFSMPTSFKIDKRERKKVLKSSVKDLFPGDFMSRKKKGFSAPLRDWLLGGLRDTVEQYLLSSTALRSGVFERRQVRELWELFENGKCRVDISHSIWALLCFELWYEQFMES